MGEREINLVDIFVEILLKWRGFIVWMLIGGLVVGGFGATRSYLVSKENAEQLQQLQSEAQVEIEQSGNEKALEYFEELLTERQRVNVQTVVNYEDFCKARTEYFENSIIMQLDYMKIPRTRITFLVKAESENKSASIVRVYEDMIGNALVNWLSEQENSEYTSDEICEVISFDRHSRDLEQGSDSFSLNVIHKTEEDSMELAKLIEDFMAEQQKGLQAQMGSHTIEVVSQSFAYIRDTSIMKIQEEFKNGYTSYASALADMKSALSVEEKQYYNYLVSGEIFVAEENVESESAKGFSVDVLYILLGMVLFAFIYAFYGFVKYITSNRLRVTDDIKTIYNISQVAIIPSDEKKKKWGHAVDAWILNIRNYNKRKFAVDEAIGLAAIAMKMAIRREKVDTIYCVGCDIRDNARKIAERIGAVLKEENISLTTLNNVLYSQEAMEQLQEAKLVFLLEQAGKTMYEEVANELELLHRQDIKVIGMVLVE